MGMFYGSKTHKQRVVGALAVELFPTGNLGGVQGGADTIYTLSKLTVQDLEYLYHVKTGRDGI